MRPVWLLAIALAPIGMGHVRADSATMPVGVARIDITPGRPIRLSGFSFRKTESEGVRQRLWAKALAFGSDADGPAVLVTIDAIGVPEQLVDDVAGRLQRSKGIAREKFVVCATHTHTGPALTNVLPMMYSADIPADHQAHIDQYTIELANKIEQVALAALADRKPARLGFAQGKAGFAINRRGGNVVDHVLPLLRVTDPDGKLRAVLLNYACHCVVNFDNLISGDWAGYAQEAIERANPGATALVAIGCGADQNPAAMRKNEFAERYGQEIGAEVSRLLRGPFSPISEPIRARLRHIDLALAKTPNSNEYAQLAEKPGGVGYHAAQQLKMLDEGKSLATSIRYPVQTWTFGNQLGMVFLGGEVVADYAHRLRADFSGKPLWVFAYANALPCYIPSNRVLAEGGYEGGGAMMYYGWPTRLAPGVEDRVVHAVQKLLPMHYYSAVKQKQFPPPKSPAEALASMKTSPSHKVELVASEPLVQDPVWIDFGSDGRLWVLEMPDYPMGMDGKWKPGGRVKILESTRQDGTFDKATTFLDGLPFPTGIMEWRKGVLIGAAPNIIYAEDTDGDGKADVKKVLYSGFNESNYNARVGGFSLGLNGMVFGAKASFQSRVKSALTGADIKLDRRDFWFSPDTGEMGQNSGTSQHGRSRDDWGNWFGDDNSNFLWHFPITDRYLARNPHIGSPGSVVTVDSDIRVFPASPAIERFNHPESVNTVTSACSPILHRDPSIGSDYYGDAFACEPAHNLVTRRKLNPKGATFTSKRAPEEQSSEFFASTDNWSRPVNVRTGPDGAIWVVDMYRYVIEHAKWISPDRLEMVDERAGDDMGRIYRIFPRDAKPHPFVNFRALETRRLAAELDHPNGTRRDIVHQQLLHRADRSAAPVLEGIVKSGKNPAARLQALCVLDSLKAIDGAALRTALEDPHPQVRRNAVRLSERLLAGDESLAKAVLARVDDPDFTVRLQLAYSLGEWRDDRIGPVLGRLLTRDPLDAYMGAAVVSSSIGRLPAVAAALADVIRQSKQTPAAIDDVLRTAVGTNDDVSLAQVIAAIGAPSGAPGENAFRAVGLLVNLLSQRKQTLAASVQNAKSEQLRAAIGRLSSVFESARKSSAASDRPLAERLAAVRLLGQGLDSVDRDRRQLASLLQPAVASDLQLAAVAALARLDDPAIATDLLANWSTRSPGVQSAILDAMMRKEAWTDVLLGAVEKKAIAASLLDSSRRQQLLEHRTDAVRDRAKRLLAADINSDRQKVIDAYASARKAHGRIEEGRKVFKQICAKCHRMGAEGHAVAPDMGSVTDKSVSALMIAVLDPNRAVQPEYLSYNAATKAGEILTGRMVAESPNSITLLAGEGKRYIVPRADLDALTSSGKSLMPEGLEKEINPQHMADLFAYIGAQQPRKTFEQNAPKLMTPESDGSFELLSAHSEVYGPTLIFEWLYGNLNHWYNTDDYAVWSLEVPTTTTYAVELYYSCDAGSAGNGFVIQSGDRQLVGRTESTGTWAKYAQKRIGQLTLDAGRQHVALRPQGPIKGALASVRAIRLIPLKATAAK